MVSIGQTKRDCVYLLDVSPLCIGVGIMKMIFHAVAFTSFDLGSNSVWERHGIDIYEYSSWLGCYLSLNARGGVQRSTISPYMLSVRRLLNADKPQQSLWEGIHS